MKATTRTLLIGAAVFLHSLGTDAVAFLRGIQSQGGTWADVDGISVAISVLLALGSLYGGLMLFLSPPPPKSQLMPTTVDNISIPDVDLGPVK